MPIYEYECRACGFRFEQRQSMTDPALRECPQCRGEVRRLIGGGIAAIFKHDGRGRKADMERDCPLESSGRTCCGRESRCAGMPREGET